MAHAQKPDFVFPRNGRVHLNRQGRQFSRLLAAELCASAVVMLDTPRSEGVWEYWLPTPFASSPFTSPPVRHRVSSGFKRTIHNTGCQNVVRIHLGWNLRAIPLKSNTDNKLIILNSRSGDSYSAGKKNCRTGMLVSVFVKDLISVISRSSNPVYCYLCLYYWDHINMFLLN